MTSNESFDIYEDEPETDRKLMTGMQSSFVDQSEEKEMRELNKATSNPQLLFPSLDKSRITPSSTEN